MPLTDSETVLLRTFAASARMTLTREELLRREAVNGSARAVDTQITRLRRKIEEDKKYPRYLRTVRGKGYVLCPIRDRRLAHARPLPGVGGAGAEAVTAQDPVRPHHGDHDHAAGADAGDLGVRVLRPALGLDDAPTGPVACR